MGKRVILVTGGNRGIGKAIVEGLAKSSENEVLLGCRDTNEGSKIASSISKNVTSVKLDLSNHASLKTDLANILSTYKKVDVLVNNAGILCEGSFSEAKEDDIEKSIFVNTLAPVFLIKTLLPLMTKNKYGRIVNVSSGWGSIEEGLGGPFSYSFSKAALNASTLCIAKDLNGDIKINAMCPGWVRTRMGGMMATRSPEEGADTAIWLSNLPKDGPNGGFFRDRKLIEW